MNRKWTSLLYLGLTLSLSNAFADTFSADEVPSKFSFQDEKFETRFSALKLSGQVDKKDGHIPWSDTFWPARYGGIGARYLDPARPDAFSYVPPTLSELRAMSPEEIRKLSPAEKFDIYRGRYDYPLLARIRRAYNKDNPSWWGICHGWTPAAANFPEPLSTQGVNPDGIVIPFASSDVKAIISFYYAWEAAQFNDDGSKNFGWDNAGKYWQKDPAMIYFLYRGMGARYGSAGDKKKDLNPGTFHVVLANLIGRYHRSFNVDVDPKKEVWNQPAYGYQSEIVKTKDGGKKVLVRTVFDYIVESTPSYNAHGARQLHAKKELVYWLELNDAGEIIGGKWPNAIGTTIGGRKSDYLDFMWRASRVPFIGEYKPLNDLYKTTAKTITSYAMGPNYTPGVIDVSAREEADDESEFSVSTEPRTENRSRDSREF
jgi:hypothetical protein